LCCFPVKSDSDQSNIFTLMGKKAKKLIGCGYYLHFRSAKLTQRISQVTQVRPSIWKCDLF
jgi:hypothetical protein